MRHFLLAVVALAGIASGQHWEFEQVDTVSWAQQTWLFEHPDLGLTVVYAGGPGRVGLAWYDTAWVTRDISLPGAGGYIRTFDVAPDGKLGSIFPGVGGSWCYVERSPDSAWQVSPLPVEWFYSNCALAFDQSGQPHVLCGITLDGGNVGAVLYTTRHDSTWVVDTVTRYAQGGSNECAVGPFHATAVGGLAGLYYYFWSVPSQEGRRPFFTMRLYLATWNSSQWDTCLVAASMYGLGSVDLAPVGSDSASYCLGVYDEHGQTFYYNSEQVDTNEYSAAALALDQQDRPLIACVRSNAASLPMNLLCRDTSWHVLEPGVDSAAGLDVMAGAPGEVLISYAKQGVWLARGTGILGVAEETGGAVKLDNRLPTILRGPELALLDCRVIDALGRDVTDRRGRLAPGIYFLRSAVGREPSAVRKVIVQR